MARHVLTVEERIRGLRKVIDSSATPDHLKPSLKRQLRSCSADSISVGILARIIHEKFGFAIDEKAPGC